MDASNAQIISRRWFVERWKTRPSDGHKGTFGHLLLIAGHEGMIGAAVLAARAALRSGVGKVTVHLPRCGRDILQIAVPEAVLQLDETSDRCWSSLIDPSPFSAIAVGPGLGTEGETAFALRSLLKNLLELDTKGKAPALILDADALNLLSTDYQLLSLLPPGSVLTPHIGEMNRLCQALDLPHGELSELHASAQSLSAALGLSIALKNHIPHLFAADGSLLIAEGEGNSALAKAGSGDVLTGLIGVIFICATVGALIGFLWYNAYPAQVFMGDTGSLTIGGIIGVLAIIIHKELLVPLLCGVFLFESVSVIVQTQVFKFFKRRGRRVRVFKSTPIHDSFRRLDSQLDPTSTYLVRNWPKGAWHEAKITVRFWITTIILAALTIITLKIR